MRFTQYKKVRLEHGLLQLELAQRARIDRCRLSLIENGHCLPTTDELERIAHALDVSIDLLAHEPAAPSKGRA